MTTTGYGLGQEAIDVDKPAKDDLQLYSVTTIIGALDKPALMYWTAEQAATAALDHEQTWKAMLAESGRADAITWLRDAMNRRPKTLLKSTDLGTVTHKVCQEYGITGTKPGPDFITDTIARYAAPTTDIAAETAAVATMLDQFDRWAQQFTPAYEATEVAVYHPEFGYAGQLDAILTIGGVKFVADYKTSRESYDRRGAPRTPYADQVGLQLAAYRNAQFAAVWRARRYEKQFRRYYLLSADEQAQAVTVPAVDTGLVIQITPEHCHAYPIRCDARLNPDGSPHPASVFHAFLYVLEAFRWVNETSKDVMGEALTP